MAGGSPLPAIPGATNAIMTAPATDACTAARDRPAPAADVRLVGELQGSGFVEQQWLVQRGERFVQVTELLYRVLEQANGIRTLDEIAEAVTESSEWLVTADDVALLVERKLVPLGVVRAEAATSPPEVAPPATDPSPLALNMRMKAVGPRLLDPITRALQYLFTPLVLVAALAFGLGAHVWLYSSHGLTAAVVDALYTPGFLPILLGLVLASGVAHELGHAAGLRYGGGRARRMGFGFYLAFPAFFTDVTDSYRLGRWARVRTGLGGVYFHFLFATALIGIALAVDAEFLFLAVLLINIEIVRQFIPFVRLDGYWVLADLTGVPDFLSQAGPFVRSLLPADRVRGPRLPRLKRWVKAAFLGYLVV